MRIDDEHEPLGCLARDPAGTVEFGGRVGWRWPW